MLSTTAAATIARPMRLLLFRPRVVSHFHTSRTAWATRKALQQFRLADIGEGITECEVIKWSVKPSSKVTQFDPLCEVQSDKASVEITSPFDGVVKELLVQEGEVAKVGSGLCMIEVEEEEGAAQEPTASAAEPATTALASALSVGTESGPRSPLETTTAAPAPARRHHPLDPSAPPSASVSTQCAPAPSRQRANGKQADVLAAPSVRYYARQQGIDLAQLAPGSGRDGRVEKKDVDSYLSGASAGADAGAGAGAGAQAPKSPAAQEVELGRTRYEMWKAMEKSLEIPHFGYSTTLDLTALHNLLPILNANIPAHLLPENIRKSKKPSSSSSVNPSALYPAPIPAPVGSSHQISRLTYLPFLLKTLSKAMIDWPLFRSSITPTKPTTEPTKPTKPKPTITVRPTTDISIALSTPSGLYTPTIQSVSSYSLYALASELAHLSHLGRQTPCGLTPKELPKRGGTVIVSNVGAVGAGVFANPLLVPGAGLAIVAVGRARWEWDVSEEVWARTGGKGERRMKVGVSWSADHRVVEGAELAAFVETWRAWVECPERLIAEGV